MKNWDISRTEIFLLFQIPMSYFYYYTKMWISKVKVFFGHPVPKCPLSVLFNSLSSCKRCSKSYKGRELVRHTSLCCCYSLGTREEYWDDPTFSEIGAIYSLFLGNLNLCMCDFFLFPKWPLRLTSMTSTIIYYYQKKYVTELCLWSREN